MLSGLPQTDCARSQDNPLDLVERDLIAPAIVELRRLWRLVVGDLLGLLERPAVEKIHLMPVARKAWQHVVSGSTAVRSARALNRVRASAELPAFCR